MSSVATYLNFQGTTEEAFTFYASVFGTEVQGPILRFGDMEGMPPLSDDEKNKIMHIELPIIDGHVLMATDALESMGHQIHVGNNISINLMLDSRDEADRLYALLGKDSTEAAPMMEMSWGYWGTALDRFGVRWMFNVGS